ncbi:MAG: 1-acyl-sn-glycerol-3-phosphate acyltransferase [Flavobacterium sp.]
MKKIIARFIFSKCMGWKLVGTFDESQKKCLAIVVPHTSWHDFYLGLLVRAMIGVKFNFVGKKELFIFPFGYYFKWLGGAPLDRSGGLNLVDAIVKQFDQREVFRIGIAPEGTRKKVDKLRTGYYYIAWKAKATIVPVAFDWSTKTVTIGDYFSPTGNYELDEPKIIAHFKGAIGKIPEYSFDVP